MINPFVAGNDYSFACYNSHHVNSEPVKVVEL